MRVHALMCKNVLVSYPVLRNKSKGTKPTQYFQLSHEIPANITCGTNYEENLYEVVLKVLSTNNFNRSF